MFDVSNGFARVPQEKVSGKSELQRHNRTLFKGVNELGLGGVCPVSIPSSTQQQFGSF